MMTFFSNTNHLTAEEQKMLPVNLDELMKVRTIIT